MYSRNWLGCLSVMYDREYFGLMQEKNVRFDDYSLWLQLISKSDCYRLDECLAKYRRRQDSWSPKKLSDKVCSLYEVFHQGMELNRICSIWWTCMNLICQVIKKLFYTKRYETGV